MRAIRREILHIFNELGENTKILPILAMSNYTYKTFHQI